MAYTEEEDGMGYAVKPTAKKAKKVKTEGEEPEEKRLRRFRGKAQQRTWRDLAVLGRSGCS